MRIKNNVNVLKLLHIPKQKIYIFCVGYDGGVNLSNNMYILLFVCEFSDGYVLDKKKMEKKIEENTHIFYADYIYNTNFILKFH